LIFSDLVNLGSAGAVIFTVGLFLAHLRHCQKSDQMEREAERDKLTRIIVNDLSHVGESLQEVKAGLVKVNSALDENTRSLRALNGRGD